MFLDAVLKFCSDAGRAERDQRDKSDESEKESRFPKRIGLNRNITAVEGALSLCQAVHFKIRHIFIF